MLDQFAQRLARPRGRLVRVAAGARVRHLELVGHVGVMNSNVWLRTFTFAIVCSIFGMWQATHSLPALPRA